ncbi:MAG: DNA polymerase IV, partial [Planctomycetota bacterium]
MAAMNPTQIIHVDMDAFFASVEQLDNPALKGQPVIVGGRPGGRGVVSAASYEARAFGVHSAMPLKTALRLCPQGVFLPVRFARYGEISKHIREIFHRYTPMVEPLSSDEAFLDVKGSEGLFGSAETIGRKIKEEILNETGLTASVGLGPNKFLAKLASDLRKPDGFVVITLDKIREI